MAGEEYGTEEIRPDFAFLTSGNLAIQRTGVDKEKLAVDDRMENVKRRYETKKRTEIEAEGSQASMQAQIAPRRNAKTDWRIRLVKGNGLCYTMHHRDTDDISAIVFASPNGSGK